MLHLQEPVSKGWYYLYLPEDYVKGGESGLTERHWPVVVSFHGMKPFDNAKSQAREWQQEADRYGFVVIAPVCLSPDLLDEFPLRTVNPRVKRDEEVTLAAMDDAATRVDIDPTHVLSTSWSSGGYLAHYMANRHPERFSCIAPRQSNFSAAVLDEQIVPKYRDTKVGIFYTQNDFAICRKESQEAARWYTRHGFDVTFAVFKDLGHERRPSVAAAFFAQNCGAKAKTPPIELARMQVTQVPLPELAGDQLASAQVAALPPASSGPRPSPGNGRTKVVQQDRPPLKKPPAVPQRQPPKTWSDPKQRTAATAAPLDVKPVREVQPRPTPAPARATAQDSAQSPKPLRIRVSSTIGIAPLLVSFSAIVPGELRRGSYFLWTVDGEPISNGINGQKYLARAGKHKLEVLMTTSDGKEYRSDKTITVLERVRDGRRGK